MESLQEDPLTPDSSYFSWDLDCPGNLSESSSTPSFCFPTGIVSGCRKRKNFVPQKSPPQDDPNFRGVTVTMKNRKVDGDWLLFIQSEFSLSPKRRRKIKTYEESSEEEEISLQNVPTPALEEKHCASCSVKKTPLWRDAEDGTPLCNACGIRYKKYKMRCGTCWHIPKKDEFHPRCSSCGSSYISPRR